MADNDYVVILHGILRTKRHMRKLATHLSARGYEVLNLNYPSTKQSLEALANSTWQQVDALTTEDKPIHFIGYSMGGLLVRAMLSKHRPTQLGRVVQLASPNHGSEVADFLRDFWIYKMLYGPAGQELTTNNEAVAALLGEVDYELGVIAGDFVYDPITPFIMKGPNDGLVSVESTKLAGMKDHITVRASHTFFPSNKTVLAQTAHFLAHGAFDRAGE